MLTEHPDVTCFICPDCDLTMKSQVALELHQKIVHRYQLNQEESENLEKSIWPCPICRHIFSYSNQGARGHGIWKHVEGD